MLDDKDDAARGLVLIVIHNDGREERVSCKEINSSLMIVKTVPRGGTVWCDTKLRKKAELGGIILRDVKSFSLELEPTVGRKWTIVEPRHLEGCWNNHPQEGQQAELMWVDNSIDSTTYRIILRVERSGKNIIAYSFIIPGGY